MKEQIEALCQKWISEEQRLRHVKRSLQADTLAKCRRELQEAAGLVSDTEESSATGK